MTNYKPTRGEFRAAADVIYEYYETTMSKHLDLKFNFEKQKAIYVARAALIAAHKAREEEQV